MLRKEEVRDDRVFFPTLREEHLLEKPRYLEEIDIITELSADDKSFLYQHAYTKKYPKNAVIHAPGDKINIVNYVILGRVKIYSLSACGKEIIYRFCTPKSFFGIAEIFGGEERAVFAEAVEPTEVLCINKANFEELVRRNPELALAVMRVLGSRVRQAHKAIKDFAVADVRARLAQLLVKLTQMSGSTANQGTITIDNKFTHQEMANMIGANRQTVTEIINDFKRQGLIRYDAGRITILDYPGIEALLTA
jgi:CRP/FNR family cyclic AMP-dependent transcriptional regulator